MYPVRHVSLRKEHWSFFGTLVSFWAAPRRRSVSGVRRANLLNTLYGVEKNEGHMKRGGGGSKSFAKYRTGGWRSQLLYFGHMRFLTPLIVAVAVFAALVAVASACDNYSCKVCNQRWGACGKALFSLKPITRVDRKVEFSQLLTSRLFSPFLGCCIAPLGGGCTIWSGASYWNATLLEAGQMGNTCSEMALGWYASAQRDHFFTCATPQPDGSLTAWWTGCLGGTCWGDSFTISNCGCTKN